MSRLTPLSEEPAVNKESKSTGVSKLKHWLKARFVPNSHLSANDLKALLNVLACPLFPISLQPLNQFDPVSSAQYIVEQFRAATGCRKLESNVRNFYATGKLTMTMIDDSTGTPSIAGTGCFVIWQMIPNKWSFELVLNNHKVVAGSDGHVAWRHTPWLPPHAAKGEVRPLRRALQGLDPTTISEVFSTASYGGERSVSGEDCFALKLEAERSDLALRGDSAAEIIKHVIHGYFSQRSGLLVYLEDTYLTRIQAPGTCPAYWETTMGSTVGEYRGLEGGLVVAHEGETSVVITRFGDSLKGGVCSRMEERWRIEDVALNVEGLSLDCFIVPPEVKDGFNLQEPFLNMGVRNFED